MGEVGLDISRLDALSIPGQEGLHLPLGIVSIRSRVLLANHQAILPGPGPHPQLQMAGGRQGGAREEPKNPPKDHPDPSKRPDLSPRYLLLPHCPSFKIGVQPPGISYPIDVIADKTPMNVISKKSFTSFSINSAAEKS